MKTALTLSFAALMLSASLAAAEDAPMTLALYLPKPAVTDDTAPTRATFNGCGWYAIMACSKSRAAMERVAGNGFLVIRTNDYPNFRPGWWCMADGPFTRSRAVSIANSMKPYHPTAYAKRGC